MSDYRTKVNLLSAVACTFDAFYAGGFSPEKLDKAIEVALSNDPWISGGARLNKFDVLAALALGETALKDPMLLKNAARRVLDYPELRADQVERVHVDAGGSERPWLRELRKAVHAPEGWTPQQVLRCAAASIKDPGDPDPFEGLTRSLASTIHGVVGAVEENKGNTPAAVRTLRDILGNVETIKKASSIGVRS